MTKRKYKTKPHANAHVEVMERKGGARVAWRRVTGHGGGGGKGGGSKSRTPVESPDSLRSTAFAKVLDVVSEGPIVGPVHGYADMGKDIYLDGTPVQNADGSFNFDGVWMDFRAGTQDQDYMQGFPASESSQGVGVEVTDSSPWTQQITNPVLSAVRITLGFPGLSRTDNTNGDISGYRIGYQIDISANGGPFYVVHEGIVDGKTTQMYERSIRIDLPHQSSSWTVRVRRTTPNANTALVQDRMQVNSYTSIIDAKLRYPMSAHFGVMVDASQFSSVPGRAYHIRGRIISVPSNYNPENRVYTGVWDGTFKQAWTDNPVWIFYDLVTNTRYGAGERLDPYALSSLRWVLYPVGQYCDEMVPDGFGGEEARFRCNAYIQEDDDAARLLTDLAAVFRGMVYEQSGAIMAAADMPQDPVYTFSSANVENGSFNYGGTPGRTRYNVAQVSWSDPDDFGRQKMEVYEDEEDIRVYGVKMTQITAFGCTSRGQAYRAGKWAILSSKTQWDTVTFTTGLEHAIVKPGSVVRVSNPARMGGDSGGRIAAVHSASEITLDRPVSLAAGDTIIVNLPSGVSEVRTVSALTSPGLTVDTTAITADSTEITADMTGQSETVTRVGVTPPFSELPQVEAVWAVENSEITNQLFRIQSVALRDGVRAEIRAIEHNPSKFSAIDYGTKLDFPPVVVMPPSVMPVPQDVRLSSYTVVDQGLAFNNGRIEWSKVDAAMEYQVQWRRDQSDWVESGRTSSTSLELVNIRAGTYVARVRALNALGIPSAWGQSEPTVLQGNLEPPPAITSLRATAIVFGILLEWTIPNALSTIDRTEIWYSDKNDRNQATLLGEFSYPQSSHTLMGLAAGTTFYFWARLRDKNGEHGDWYPISATGGVMGRASVDATQILQYLTAQITATQLAQSLLARIDNGGNAQVQIDAIINELAAMYTIKTRLTVNGVPYMAGIGVGVENNQGIITSQILLAANRVAVLNEVNGQTVAPFVIQGGQTFIAQALIGTAWIKTANIEDAAVTNAKIGYLAVGTANIQDLSVFQSKIANATISTAKIGEAQIDTLRISGGAVVTGTSAAFNMVLGSSGAATAPIASLSMNVPYGGTLLAFIQVSISDLRESIWGVRRPRVVASISGVEQILNLSVPAAGSGSEMANPIVQGFCYIYGPVNGGSFSLFVDGGRPISETVRYFGRVALLGIQR